MKSRVVGAWFGLIARLVVAGVWIAAGYLKVGDPTENVRAVRAYDLLPESLVPVIGHTLPILELVVGICLLVGLFVRPMAVLSAVMFLAFVIGISSAWARGLSIDCGCFGGGGPAENATEKYPWEIARDVGLFLLSAYLVWRPRTPYALDDKMLPDVPTTTDHTADAPVGKRKGAGRARAAEIRREAARKEQKQRNATVATIGLVLIAMIVGIGYAVQASRDATGGNAKVPEGVVDGYALPYGSTEDDPAVVVQIYEDPLCPFCAQFEEASAEVIEKWADQGVQFRFQMIAILDSASTTGYSSRAMNAMAVVLHYAGLDVAKEFHDELFRRQPSEGGPGLSDDVLVDLAVDAGASRDEVSEPIESRQFRRWIVNANDAASRAGITQTPTIIVDGTPLPAQDIQPTVAAMDKAIEEALSKTE